MLTPGETQRLGRILGKFAFLFAGVYVMVLYGGAVTIADHDHASWATWPALVLPAAAFVPAVIYAVGLHRDSPPERARTLRRRCLACTAAGLALLTVVGAILSKVNS